MEELDKGWTSDIVLLVNVAGHLNTFSKELQGRDTHHECLAASRLSNLTFMCGKIN